MAFPQHRYPPTQYHFLGSNDQEAFRRQEQELERRRKHNTQVAIGLTLSRIDKAEFGEDILNCMFESEVNTQPDVSSIDIQMEIEWYMRPYLLDFLVEAHAAFSLPEETLFLTFNILDRYCSQRVVYRKHYQLVGCTALLIAAKFDETGKQVPHVKELMSMCCGLYDEDMFIQMERHVLMTLEWCVGAPTAAGFVRSALDDAPFDIEMEHMSLYLCEVAMYHRDFVSQRPSDIARVAIAISHIILRRRSLLGRDHWSAVVDQSLTSTLFSYLAKPSEILVQKYKQPQYSYVALLVDSYVIQQAAIAQAAVRTPPITPESSQERVVPLSCTPRKRRYPYDIEIPPSPPITPGTDIYNKGYSVPQIVFNAPDTPAYEDPAPYTASFTMIDAP